MTLETLLEEKRAFDLSVKFEKLGSEDESARGWREPGIQFPQLHRWQARWSKRLTMVCSSKRGEPYYHFSIEHEYPHCLRGYHLRHVRRGVPRPLHHDSRPSSTHSRCSDTCSEAFSSRTTGLTHSFHGNLSTALPAHIGNVWAATRQRLTRPHLRPKKGSFKVCRQGRSP